MNVFCLSPSQNRVAIAPLLGLLWVTLICTACTDTVTPGDCSSGQTWNEITERCVADTSGNAGGGSGDTENGADGGTSSEDGEGTGDGEGPGDAGSTGDDEEDVEEIDPCVGLECDQVDCPPGSESTTLTGVVSIPSGELPLPNVSVYIPNSSLGPIVQGASCERCEDILSGDPLVQTTTNIHGEFRLENVPVGENIPLVIQTGKWRRQISIDNVDECTENPIVEVNTRLPRNQSEGDIPRIAMTTGYWDALECLLYSIGIDDEEFTTANDDSGSITLFAGPPGATDRFANGFQGGENFTYAEDWWDDLDNLTDYDIVMHSCDFPDSTAEGRQALQDFADVGGRAFMTDLHREWLEYGPPEFQSVAQWRDQSYSTQLWAEIDTSQPGGSTLFNWMNALGALDFEDEFPIFEIWNNIASVNTDVAERWIFSQGYGEEDHYFAFNTPVGADENNQCGRVVYSDLHVAAGGGASPGEPFPDSCTSDSLSGQEMALIYMFFDLSGCIAPECEPATCEDFGNCGTHPDGCGGSISCDGICCVEIEESCDTDADCCDNLWCDDDTGSCSDRCRTAGERCFKGSDCCSDVCSSTGGEEGTCIVQ